MKKLIIFDFNRTLYDPDKRKLIPGALLVLKELTSRGYSMALISMAAPSREALFDELGITEFFEHIIVTNDKSLEDFQTILKKESYDRAGSFVVGDRVKQEITLGNSLGIPTIWIQNGKFAKQLPENIGENPTHVVSQLKDILSVVP